MRVIIYGSQGTGKTLHKEQFLRYFGGKRIIEEWIGRDELLDGDIALTHFDPPFAQTGCHVISIQTAIIVSKE